MNHYKMEIDQPETPWWEQDDKMAVARRYFEIGYASETGIGRPLDLDNAILYYRKSAMLGYPPAQNGIAFLHATGRGVPMSEKIAFEWFQRAADAGHSGAQMNLGVMYAEGRGIEKDDTEALCYFYKAAMSGNCEAQEFLAHALQDGLCGLTQNHDEAAFWFEQAMFERNLK